MSTDVWEVSSLFSSSSLQAVFHSNFKEKLELYQVLWHLVWALYLQCSNISVSLVTFWKICSWHAFFLMLENWHGGWAGFSENIFGVWVSSNELPFKTRGGGSCYAPEDPLFREVYNLCTVLRMITLLAWHQCIVSI